MNGMSSSSGSFRQLHERLKIGMRLRDQDRCHRIFARDIERRIGEAQEKIRAGRGAAFEFFGIGGIDADFMSSGFQRAYTIFEMGNGVSGSAPRSITSAPSARIFAARATMASTDSADASTISLKMRIS